MTAVMRGGTCQCHAAIRLSLAGRLETAPAQQLTVHCYAYYVTSRKWAQHSTTAPQHHTTTAPGPGPVLLWPLLPPWPGCCWLTVNCCGVPSPQPSPGWFKKYTHNFLLVLIDGVTLCPCDQRHVIQ